MSLVPCPECQRHVQASDGACPFCETERPRRTSAVGVAAVTLGLALTQGCYGAPPVREDGPKATRPAPGKPEGEAPTTSATPR